MRSTMDEMAAIVAAQPDYQPEVTPEFERRRTPEINVLPQTPWQQAMTALTNTVRTMRAAVVMSAASLRDKREPRVRFSR